MMKDFWLIACVGAAMLYGFVLMWRLDGFLAANSVRKDRLAGPKNLRIAFANPWVADTIALPLERLTKAHKNMKVYLYTGEAQEISNRLRAGELDIAFLPRLAKCEDLPMCDRMSVTLEPESVESVSTNLPIDFLEKKSIVQCVWRKNGYDGCTTELLNQIMNA